ncbi:hypothetical protein [Labedella endophytica]|uniref:Uncharacterized protein n=1 Tax=Labedella endophytica TaxID=1523160 RepID=A0A433JQN8_9MICO|nr:hypothetical protein [Labedella endophytica]RUQ99074.1 hypothetical protein ELQ94_12225 [Labedella endophytica]
MSSGQPIQSDRARRTIARFAGASWTAGAIIMALIAFGTFSRLAVDGDTGRLFEPGGGGYSDYPWEDENLPEAQPDANDPDVYVGNGNAVIRIDGVTTAPLQVTPIDGEYIRLSMTESGDIDPELPVEDREWPLRVGYPQEDLPSVVFPYAGTLELWVQADEQWILRIEELVADEITDVVSGQGNRLLVYRGNAVSALFEFVGDGVFIVTAYSREVGEESLIIESDPIEQRQSWSPSDVVVLSIESSADRGAWVVDIDSYDDDDESTPTPGETPTTSSEPTDPPTEQETP